MYPLSILKHLLVDAEQYAVGDGPCLHAARTGEVVRADSMVAAQQWPVFVDAARRACDQ